jgi:quercetin dioxygenase-like cupin family protein
MTVPYTLLHELARQIDPPADGTLSRTLYLDERLKAVLFGFSAGQELSEHTSSTPAILHFLSGEAEVGLGSDRVHAAGGTWIHMPAQLPHSIRTQTPVTMLLLLLK